MKNKRILAVLATVAVASQSFAAFATEKAPELFVGENKVEAGVILHDENMLLPLRAIAEGAGYEVNWIAQSGTVVVKTNEGEITLNPVAPQAKTVSEGYIINDRTYVSVDFIDEMPGLACEKDEEGNIKVSLEEKEEMPTKMVTINEIGDGYISVNDEEIGEVILMISPETKITENGEEIELADITETDALLVSYSPAMTMSLPPQTTAVSIEVVCQAVEFEGEITEINEEGHIIVKGENDPYGIALIASEDSEISHERTKRIYKAEDLEVGMKVSGTHSTMMTRSLPPQSALLTLVIK